MLEHLSPREFEEYCQLLLTSHYQCKVVLTKQTGDEGRDLLIYHSSGVEVVECKHWPNGVVGRPVVQKLHSAVLTANSIRGSIVTTGRFSTEAETYAKNLNDVTIELIDSAKLAYLSSRAFPNGGLPAELSSGLPTTPDGEFSEAFTQSVFSKSRYQCRSALKNPIRVERVTKYKAYFIANYQAQGIVSRTGGKYSEAWDGSIWIKADGSQTGFGWPRTSGPNLAKLVPLAEVLKKVPGQTMPPKIQPHQAVAEMKAYIAGNCSTSISYQGQNNRNYSATIKPNLNTIILDSLMLCYLPFQKFVLVLGDVQYEGKVEEQGSPTDFHVTCPSLSECTVCGTATTADNQVFCSICSRPAHRHSFLFPDSFHCQKCGDVICRKHTVNVGNKNVCTRCAKNGRPLGARWLRHCQIGLAGSALFGLLTLVVMGLLSYKSYDIVNPATGRLFVIGLLLVLAAWIPFLCVILQSTVLEKHKGLTYPKIQGEKPPTKKPDWLYGNTT